MNAEYLLEMYRYNFWAHRRVWGCVEQLTEAQFDTPLDYSIGAIHNQVAHTMGVEYWWFNFLATGDVVFVAEGDLATRATIRAKWDEIEQRVLAYLATVTPAELQREVRPYFWGDARPPITVYEAIIQVAMHSQDHRAQTLAGLFRLGAPTVEIDLLFYAWEKRGAPGNENF